MDLGMCFSCALLREMRVCALSSKKNRIEPNLSFVVLVICVPPVFAMFLADLFYFHCLLAMLAPFGRSFAYALVDPASRVCLSVGFAFLR